MADIDEDELLADLGLEVAPLKASSRTPREERIIAGFEDVLRFHQTHGRAPLHGEGRDIFERLYAVRLDQLRKLPQTQALLAGLDGPGLLSGAAIHAACFPCQTGRAPALFCLAESWSPPRSSLPCRCAWLLGFAVWSAH